MDKYRHIKFNNSIKMTDHKQYKKALFISNNKSIIIYLREINDYIYMEHEQYHYAIITRTNGKNLEIIDDHPLYLSYNGEIMNVFNGFLDENKEISIKKHKYNDNVVTNTVYPSGKHKYQGRIIYQCNMNYDIINLSQKEIDKYTKKI